jgi:hypothetical protein
VRTHPSLGHFYRNLALRVIPPGDEVEGSMMALAAFGDPDRHYKELRDLVHLGEHGHVHIAAPWGSYDADTPLGMEGAVWTAQSASAKPMDARADLAAAAQRIFAEARVSAPDTPPRHILLTPCLAALQHSRRTHRSAAAGRPLGSLRPMAASRTYVMPRTVYVFTGWAGPGLPP